MPEGELPDTVPDSIRVIIPSARSQNLRSCVKALLDHEPTMKPENIIVIDDGARAEAEEHLPALTWITGEKPFIFARNINAGIAQSPGDVVLLNDDAFFETDRAVTHLWWVGQKNPEAGIIGSSIVGKPGNPIQALPPNTHSGVRPVKVLAFVCVFIPHRVLKAVGKLDERFVGYGSEDVDYCRRTQIAGYELLVSYDSVVNHGTKRRSTFAAREDIGDLQRLGRQIYQEKWGPKQPKP